MNWRTAQLLAITAGIAGLLLTAYLMIMTTLMVYDDEGFVLITLRNFLTGQPLYDVVFSQYGPAPYLYHWLLTLGGTLELTHMFGRLITMIHWVVCAISVGWITSQLADRHRFATGVFGTLCSFNLLWQMIAEPSHPGSMIAALLAVTAAVSVKSLQEKSYSRFAAMLGLAGSILVLTKVNVGGFFITGVGAFALIFTAWAKPWEKLARGFTLVGISLLPWLLMMGNLDDFDFLGFTLKASLAGAGVWWLLPRSGPSLHVPPKTWLHTVAWFVAGLLLIGGFIMMKGTSFSELIAAVIIDPLRQPGHFTVPPQNSFHSGITAIFSFTIVAWAGWSRDRNPTQYSRVLAIAAFSRFTLLVVFIWFAFQRPSPWGVFTYLDYVLPLLPLWLVRKNDGEASQTLIAGLLSFLCLTQVLHAYPVAGSQIGWGCFLSITIIAPGVQRDLYNLFQNKFRPLAIIGGACALIVAGMGTLSLGQAGWHRYNTSSPFPFAGAGDIRIDDHTRISITSLVQNAMVHSDVLFTRQGMYSYNIWSGVPTPTAKNATHWFWLLDEQEQQEIINRLVDADRSAVIVNKPLDAFLARIDIQPSGPLQELIENDYQTAFNILGFDFRVPVGHEIAKLGMVLVYLEETEETEGDPTTPWTIMLNVLIQGTPAVLEIIDFDQEGNAYPSDLGLTDIQITPARRDGALMTEGKPFGRGQNLEGIFNLTARSDQPAENWSFWNKGLVIKDADGHVLAEALFE